MSAVLPNPGLLIQAVPAIAAVIPGAGPTGGGNSVLLLGANLNTVTSVTFGGVPAPINVQDPLGLLLVTAPPHAAGAVQVIATNPSGPSAPAAYTYVAPPPPAVTILTPTSGPAAGGTPITIVGLNLTGATVTFNGVPATNVVVSAGGVVLTGVTPAGTAGPAAVVVTTPSGSATVVGGYTYV